MNRWPRSTRTVPVPEELRRALVALSEEIGGPRAMRLLRVGDATWYNIIAPYARVQPSALSRVTEALRAHREGARDE